MDFDYFCSGAQAKVALSMYPPWKLDRFLSGNYIRDYVDREHGFGGVNVVSGKNFHPIVALELGQYIYIFLTSVE